MPYLDCPRLTRRMRAIEFRPLANSAYIFAGGPEDRAAHVDTWRNAMDVRLVEVMTQGDGSITVRTATGEAEVYLRSDQHLAELLRSLPDEVYLDITGLSYHVWAPLLRSSIALGKRLWAVYVEPGEYTRTATPTEGIIYDLSERISGIAPLPGFATLFDPDATQYRFVPLLGFEGTRLIFVTEHVQPPADATVPVVGVPGFRAEYPFVTFNGNRKALLDGAYWMNARYAAANCPFDLFFLLRRIAEESGKGYLRIAPIGTKPHGLGALLFALSAEDRLEIIYDHPIRKAGRTVGSARLCLYDIGTFVRSGDFRWAL